MPGRRFPLPLQPFRGNRQVRQRGRSKWPPALRRGVPFPGFGSARAGVPPWLRLCGLGGARRRARSGRVPAGPSCPAAPRLLGSAARGAVGPSPGAWVPRRSVCSSSTLALLYDSRGAARHGFQTW